MPGNENLRPEVTEALSRSIDMLNQGKSVEECVALYPSLRDDLEPLLRVAVGLRQVHAVQPSPAFTARIHAKLDAAYAKRMVRKPGFFQRLLSPGPRWAAAASLAVVVMMGAGTVRAAADSLPDSPLYPVKQATEQIQLTFTPTTLGKARLHAQFADMRAKEIAAMAGRGNPQRMQWVATQLENDVQQAAVLAMKTEGYTPVKSAPMMNGTPGVPMMKGPTPYNPAPGRSAQRQSHTPNPEIMRLRDTLKRNFMMHQQMFERAMTNASPKGQAVIQQIIQQNNASYERALQYLNQLDSGK